MNLGRQFFPPLPQAPTNPLPVEQPTAGETTVQHQALPPRPAADEATVQHRQAPPIPSPAVDEATGPSQVPAVQEPPRLDSEIIDDPDDVDDFDDFAGVRDKAEPGFPLPPAPVASEPQAADPIRQPAQPPAQPTALPEPGLEQPTAGSALQEPEPDEDMDDTDDIDDFGHLPPAPVPSTVDTPVAERKWRPRTYQVFIGAGAIVVLVVVALVMVLQSGPPELTTTPRIPPGGEPVPTAVVPAVTIELAEPDDLGDQVVLRWTSNSANLDFAVVVSQENAPTKTTVVPQRNHTAKVPVDAVSTYCFQIEATSSDPADPRVYQSQARPIRGGACHH